MFTLGCSRNAKLVIRAAALAAVGFATYACCLGAGSETDIVIEDGDYFVDESLKGPFHGSKFEIDVDSLLIHYPTSSGRTVSVEYEVTSTDLRPYGEVWGD